MKIQINENPAITDTEIVIHCNQADEKILKIVSMLRVYDEQLIGNKGDSTYILEAEKVLYIDTVDKKTFLYTAKEVYETPLKLYELEEKLAANDFFRASKSTIVNFRQIQSLRPEFGGRLILAMTNKEQLYVSRQYAGAVKKKLGIY